MTEPATHRYVGSEFPEVLKKPNVEYRQANLTIPCMSAAIGFLLLQPC